MAEVFSGHAVGDHGFLKPVAIKRLLPELANDEVFVERLIEEAKLLVGLQHGNIVSVLDLAREGDDVFLVMELVDGLSLRQLIKARGARGLSFGVTTYIVESAAAGLEVAHARPGGAIIHADVSPSNLLLTTSGEVRVADFGIARREGPSSGAVEGKWAYMAPEQARGESLTPRSDVFALGVVLYELLTGQHPFGRLANTDARNDRMRATRVTPPRVVKPAVPPGLDAICMRALAHEARDRYGRMQQLIDALVDERFASGYRDGAPELAQMIREGAPNPEPGSPRTMQTDRPVTIVTRSLLPDLAPARPPTYPSAPLGPLDPPPRDAFPLVPTVGGRIVDAPPHGEVVPVPASGAQTTQRFVDQAAFAHSAEIAAARLALGGSGGQMPPFRLPSPGVAGDPLASVVGGQTSTGTANAPGYEPRAQRWTIAVLAVAALFGIAVAVVIQRSPSSHAPVAPVVVPPAQKTVDPGVVPAPAVERAPSTPDVRPPATAPSPVPAASPDSPPPAAPAVHDSSKPPTEHTRPITRRIAAATGKRQADGVLLVEAAPWAQVTIGDQMQETPGAKFVLAPGTYTVRLYNPDSRVTKFRRVVIEAGERKKLDQIMEP